MMDLGSRLIATLARLVEVLGTPGPMEEAELYGLLPDERRLVPPQEVHRVESPTAGADLLETTGGRQQQGEGCEEPTPPSVAGARPAELTY